jgi:alanine racemase
MLRPYRQSMERHWFSGRPVWAEIDLDAIADNVTALKRHLNRSTQLMAVVKANAYGHGAEMVARTALESGATWLGVNTVDEGIQLRRAGLTVPILVLGHCPPQEAAKVVANHLTPTVTTLETALALAGASAERGLVTPVHIKVDTGMGRYGLLPEEVVAFARRVAALPSLSLEGLWTHFATAEEADQTFTWQQFAVYQAVTRNLADQGLVFPLHHAANSAATIDSLETHLDLVRCGLSIYGLYPSPQTSRAVPLRPALALKARLARVCRLPAGASVGYGRTWVATRPSVIALVPLGYADGYRRALSNRGVALVHGQRVPLVGRVSMDQLTVDVSSVPDVRPDDEVVLIGRQGEAEITADEVADMLGTINYEVTTAIATRVPRLYRRGGEVVRVQTLVE